MSRTELRCDSARRVTRHDVTRSDILAEAGLDQKCGHLLARSPELGEHVQWSAGKERVGEVWLVDHDRHLACVYVEELDGIAVTDRDSETVAWTALRPCNGSPIR